MMHLCNPGVTEAFLVPGEEPRPGRDGWVFSLLVTSEPCSLLPAYPCLVQGCFLCFSPSVQWNGAVAQQLPEDTRGRSPQPQEWPQLTLAALWLSPVPSLLLHQREQGQRQPVLLYSHNLHPLYFLSSDFLHSFFLPVILELLLLKLPKAFLNHLILYSPRASGSQMLLTFTAGNDSPSGHTKLRPPRMSSSPT